MHACRARAVLCRGAYISQKAEKLGGEDFGASQRGERRAGGGNPDREVDLLSVPGAERERITGAHRRDLPRIDAKFQLHGIAPIQRRLRDLRRPLRRSRPDRGHGHRAPLERRDVGRVQKRQLPPLSLPVQLPECPEEPVELGDPVRRASERCGLPLLVLKVPLDAHGAEKEPAEVNHCGIGSEGLVEGAGAAFGASGHGGISAGPPKWCNASGIGPRGKSQTFVVGVGPEVHDPGGALINVDLDRVSACVFVKAGLISLVCSSFIHPRLRERQDSFGASCRHNDLK